MLGSFLTYWMQRKNFDKQHQHQFELWKINEDNKNKIDKFNIYNRVLATSKRYRIAQWHPNPSGHHFDIPLYEEKIRPLLYERLEILDEDILHQISKIEMEVERCNWNEDIDQKEHNSLYEKYTHFLNLVTEQYDNKISN